MSSLDFIGRARMFYSYAAEIEGQGRSEDDIAYLGIAVSTETF